MAATCEFEVAIKGRERRPFIHSLMVLLKRFEDHVRIITYLDGGDDRGVTHVRVPSESDRAVFLFRVKLLILSQRELILESLQELLRAVGVREYAVNEEEIEDGMVLEYFLRLRACRYKVYDSRLAYALMLLLRNFTEFSQSGLSMAIFTAKSSARLACLRCGRLRWQESDLAAVFAFLDRYPDPLAEEVRQAFLKL